MRTATFEPPLVSRRVQLLLMIGVALVLSNMLLKGPLPFSAGYHFPLRGFLAIAIAILSICEAHKAIFRYLDKRLPFHEQTAKRVVWQTVAGLAATLAVFVPLRMISTLWDNEELSTKAFLLSAFVALSVSTAADAAYIIAYLLRSMRYREEGWRRRSIGPMENGSLKRQEALTIATGNRTLVIEPENIHWWFSSGGTVTVVKADGHQFTTNYNSLTAIAEKLDDRLFFHLNRQVIANIRSIDSVQEAQNGKLIVCLKTAHPSGEVLRATVSRYKKVAFCEWFGNRSG